MGMRAAPRLAWRHAATVRGALVTGSGRRLGDLAAESAFFLALAILPMMLTTTGVLKAARHLLRENAQPSVEHGLAQLLRVVLASRGGAAADAAQRLLSDTTRGLLTAGTVISFVVLTRAVRSLLTGLHALRADQLAVTGRAHRRRWADAAGLAALLVIATAVTLALIVLGPLLGYADQVAPHIASTLRSVWFVARWPVGLAVLLGWVMLLHAVGLRDLRRRMATSPRRLRWRAAWVGAAVSTVGAAAATLLLPVYVEIGSRLSPTIGLLGGGLILLVWAYLIAYVLLLGGQVRARLAWPGDVTDGRDGGVRAGTKPVPERR